MEFDPCNMNNEEFNTLMYIQKYIVNSPVQYIVSKRNNIDAEIQALTSDIQALLYDNYSKIFDASSVVSELRKNFDIMTEDIETLQANIFNLKESSSKILSTLQPSKEKLLILTNRRNCFRKLASLANLVPNLNKFLEECNYAECLEQYLKAEKVLKKYQFLPSIADIAVKVDKLLTKMKNSLKEGLDLGLYSCTDVSLKMEMLLKLGEQHDSVLLLLFKTSQEKLDSVFCDIDHGCKLCSAGVDKEAKEKILLLRDLSFKNINTLTDVAKIARRVFFQKHSNEVSLRASKLLEHFVATNSEKLFSKIRLCLHTLFESINDEYLSYIIDQLYREIYSCFTVLPNTSFLERNSDFILTVSQDRCLFHLDRLISGFKSLLSTLCEKLRTEIHLNNRLEWFETKINVMCLHVLAALRNYIKPEYKYSRDAQFRRLFYNVLCKEKVFEAFLQHSIKIVSERTLTHDRNDQLLPVYLILLSKFAVNMQESMIDKLFSLVEEKLSVFKEHFILKGQHDYSIQFKFLAEELLHQYVKVRTEDISHMLKNSFENRLWTEVTEPRRVSAVIRRILDDIANANREVKSLYGDAATESRDSTSDSCNYAPKINSLGEHANCIVYSNISKLFNKTPIYMNEINFTTDSILNCITKITLKSFLEYTRQRTFKRYGFQQVQVDVHCLQFHIAQLLKREQDFVSLFEDIMSSCFSRCLEPEFMNPHIVTAICQKL